MSFVGVSRRMLYASGMTKKLHASGMAKKRTEHLHLQFVVATRHWAICISPFVVITTRRKVHDIDDKLIL